MKTFSFRLVDSIQPQKIEGAEVIPIKKIEVTETETVTTVKEYDVEFLLNQKVAIQAQLDAFTEARQKELDEIDVKLNGASGLGVKIEPIDMKPILKEKL